MFATTSLNGVIGHAALIVGLAACAFGALGLAVATITHDGHTYDVDRPEVVPFADAAGLYSDRDRRSLEQFRVEECLRLRKAVVLTS